MQITLHDVDSKVEDYPRHQAVAVSVLPNCDICTFVERKTGSDIKRALFDAKTHHGSWANMCHPHMQTHGVGLGLGVGQRLVIPGLGEAMRRHPAGKGR